MDWAFIIDILLKALGSLAVTVITGLAGIIFAKLSSKIKDSRLTSYIKEAVKAAEQLFPNQGIKRGTQKYDYVVQCVMSKFPKLANNTYLKSLIEGAVFALNNELENIKETVTNTNTTDNTNKKLVVKI